MPINTTIKYIAIYTYKETIYNTTKRHILEIFTQYKNNRYSKFCFTFQVQPIKIGLPLQ